MNRKIALALILVMAVSTLSIVTVKPAFARNTIPTPYVPEFSVTYIASSYSVNTTNTDTGATVTNTYANDTVQIVILNQAFNRNALENGTALSLTYNVQEEGHFSNGNYWNPISTWVDASNSEYTVISYEVTLYTGSFAPIWSTSDAEVTAGGQVDFQVEATIGYWITVPSPYSFYGASAFTGESSGWSNTQTITIANGSTSTSISNSPYPTPSPTPLATLTPLPMNSTVTTQSQTTPNPMISPNPTVTPQNPTTAIQPKTDADVSWIQIALIIAVVVIAALVVVVVALMHGYRKTANLSK